VAAHGVIGVVAVLAMALAGCQQGSNPEAQRIDQLNLKIEQLEQRLNKLASERHDGSDRQGKPPAGRIKSLTLRTGTEDDRLRIYWADGSTTDLPCTKEQSTFVCG
jgi:outer membrane murein-binding lipoprotein Lpp